MREVDGSDAQRMPVFPRIPSSQIFGGEAVGRGGRAASGAVHIMWRRPFGRVKAPGAPDGLPVQRYRVWFSVRSSSEEEASGRSGLREAGAVGKNRQHAGGGGGIETTRRSARDAKASTGSRSEDGAWENCPHQRRGRAIKAPHQRRSRTEKAHKCLFRGSYPRAYILFFKNSMPLGMRLFFAKSILQAASTAGPIMLEYLLVDQYDRLAILEATKHL